MVYLRGNTAEKAQFDVDGIMTHQIVEPFPAALVVNLHIILLFLLVQIENVSIGANLYLHIGARCYIMWL